MLSAFVWGFIAAFSLVIGGLIASWMTISQRTLGLIMAFGAGVLISAVAYELVFEAVRTATATGFPILGLFVSATATLAAWWIARLIRQDPVMPRLWSCRWCSA